ncbi:MAG: DUF1934 domain-containing protein [Eubacterium sp.]|nr:DUF1934 domain-containing protein [Eubacterium sp.]MBQ9321363.1 DUF1934 domain-containing protein [Eubacterium sp.]
MTKDVLVKVKGFQFAAGDSGAEPIELVAPGKYYYHKDHHYVVYEENAEGYDLPTQNYMKFNADSVEIRKKGLINVNMLFEIGKRTMSPYQTPLGTLELGISATGIHLKERENALDLTIDYALSLDADTMVDCTVQVAVEGQGI